MAYESNYVRQEIDRGIKAHKAHKSAAAWLHFQAALREDPQSIMALLWLAYLAEDHEKRMFLLNRVLEIDPNNQRAKAGLTWAEKAQQQARTAAQENASQQAARSGEDDIDLGEDQFITKPPTVEDVTAIKKKLQNSDDLDEFKRQARKGTIAQRARRRISP